jgi:protein-export membrane protein SecD
MNRLSSVFIFTAALSLFSLYFLFPNWFRGDFSSTKPNLTLGLDLQGGMYLKLAVDVDKLPKDPKTGKPTISNTEAVDRALEILRNRVDAIGVAEPILQREGDHWVTIQLPGLREPERALQVIGQTAQLHLKLVSERIKLSDLVDADNNTVASKIPEDVEVLNSKSGNEGRLVVEKKILLAGDCLEDARVDFGQNQFGNPVISFTLTPDGAKRFAELTSENVGRRLAIILDGKVQSAPTIKSRIPGGKGIIEGSFSADEAKDLALVLRSGALPAPMTIINQYVVGPALGADTIRRGTQAAVLGTLAVLAYIAFYYRSSGLIADVALLFNLLYLMGALAALKATLTLPGLAGIVLTMGMSVDSNVIIFERIREELRAGKTVRTAIDAGYSHAFWTVFDSHVTSLITALVLFQFGTGPIKGFAVTLSLGVAISLFTALVVSRAIFNIRKQREFLSI